MNTPLNTPIVDSCPATLSEHDFWTRYKPITQPDGDTMLSDEKRAMAHDINHVWTVVDCDEDDSMLAEPGFHLVNRIGFIITEVPWATGNETGYYSDPLDEDELEERRIEEEAFERESGNDEDLSGLAHEQDRVSTADIEKAFQDFPDEVPDAE